MTRLLLAVLTACVALFAGNPVFAAGKTWPKRDVPDFNVLFNEDGDNNFPSPDPEFNRKHLRDSVDSMAGSGIKTHLRCIAAGSDVVYYPSKVASMVGWRQVPVEVSMIKNGRISLAAGVEPLRIVGQRCKELGIHFFPTVRMNDAHFARTPETHQLTGKFWMDNKDDKEMILPGNRFNFAHEKVRQYRLGQITEALDLYGELSSGVELDFNRHAAYFPKGQERERAPLMTQLVEQVREKLDALEKQHGRPFYLIVRVQPSLAESQSVGLDVDDWMRRRLVDAIVPTSLYNVVYEMPLDDYLPIARESGCRVYPTIYIRTQYTWPFVKEPTEALYAADPSTIPTTELVAGFASNYWSKGVDGFEMYNYHLPAGPTTFAHARTLTSPAALTLANRTYMLTPSHGSDGLHDPRNRTIKPDHWKWKNLKQLPVELAMNKPAELTMLVGDDFTDSTRLAPDYSGIRLGVIGAGAETKLKITLNGQPVHDGPIGPHLTKVTGGSKIDLQSIYVALPERFAQLPIQSASLKKGDNLIKIELIGGADSVKLVELQVGVIYEPRSRRYF